MSTSDSAIDPEAVRRLVLARLLVRTRKALSTKQVLAAVVQAIAPPVAKPEAARAASAALEDCERRGYVVMSAAKRQRKAAKAKRRGRQAAPQSAALPPKSSQTARPVLSAAGHRALPKLFGLADLFTLKSWEQAQQLAALSSIGQASAALSCRGDEGLSQDELAAVLIAAEHELESPLATEPAKQKAQRTRRRSKAAGQSNALTSAVVDRLAWRALGVERDDAFTAESVQRFLLRDVVPERSRVRFDVWRRMIAGKAVGASRQDAKSLTRALLCRPGTAEAAAPAPAKPEKARTWSVRNDNAQLTAKTASPVVPPPLADFARAVQETARSPRVARFHDDRAFIGSVWENMRGQSPIGDMSLEDFKQTLIRAHREKLLRITRADLVRAMDPEEVRRSEARYQDATFHFVALDAGGMR